MAPKNELSELTTRAMQDIQNLKAQIEKLLSTMEVVDNIRNVPTIPLPSDDVISRSTPGAKASVRMEWKDAKKERKKGKVLPAETPRKEDVYGGMSSQGEHGTVTSALEKMETSVKNSSMKYVLREDSVFVAPVLERCVLGMTIVNASEKKLPPPVVRLSLLPEMKGSSSDEPRRTCRSFLYDVRVFLKDGESFKQNDASLVPLNHVQDSFSQHISQGQEFSVAHGIEVLVTANFSYPFQIISSSDRFNLLVTVSVEGKELWTKKIVITNSIFNAAVIDFTFKKHQMDIIGALEMESHCFGIERISKTEEEHFPKRLLERFLFPFGFESITSYRSGIDKTVEFYTTNQPSMFWGTSFMIETCSIKKTVARCLLTTRTRGQVQTLMQLFKTWLQKEINKDRRNGFHGPKLFSLNARTNTHVKNRFEHEIQLLQQLLDIKLVRRNGSKTASGSRNAALSFSNKGEPSGLDSSWIHEYSVCVTKTDAIFVDKMKY